MCTLCPGLRRQGTGQCHVRIPGLWVSRVPGTAQERRRWSHSRGALGRKAKQRVSMAHCAMWSVSESGQSTCFTAISLTICCGDRPIAVPNAAVL